MIFNDYFKNIYIINLDEHKERWNNCLVQLGLYNINYKRFSGIKINNGETLSDRRIGCKLSHLNIIKEAKDKNFDNVLILEDDMEFCNNFHCYMDEIVVPFIDNKDNEWELFYLGGNIIETYEKINNSIIKVKTIWTTHAYIVNNNCYDKIITNIENSEDIPIDVLYSDKIVIDKKSYCVFPRIVFQKPGFSYICGRYDDFSEYLKDEIL